MADARLIDGKAIAAALRQQVAEAAAILRERQRITAGLAAILAGHDPASEVYIRSKARACTEAGIASFEFRLPADADVAAILELDRETERRRPGRRHPRPACHCRAASIRAR